MEPLLSEQGFKAGENGEFSNDTKKVLVAYDEEKQMYRFSIADIDGDYKEVSAWLFDDSQNAKDAASVGIDFAATLRKELGITAKRVGNNNIELPSASKSGNMTVTGFAKKMLDVYPTMKEEYKEHIAVYGNFLYINFFGESLVPNLKNTFENGSKKQIKKLYDVFEDAYLKGDKDTVNILVSVLCAAAYKNENITAAIREMLEVDKHFLASFDNLLPIFHKNKKLANALIK
jgi:hypothetical protein